MKDKIKERVALYLWEIMHKKTRSYPNQCIRRGYRAHDDPWARMVLDLVADLGVDLFDGPKSSLKKRFTEVVVVGVLEQKRQLVSLNCMLSAHPRSLV